MARELPQAFAQLICQKQGKWNYHGGRTWGSPISPFNVLAPSLPLHLSIMRKEKWSFEKIKVQGSGCGAMLNSKGQT